MAARRVVFRCSFGGSHGWGHVIRCSALADQFRLHGWETLLWSEGDLASLPADVANAFSESSRAGGESASILVVDEMYTEQNVLEGIISSWKGRSFGGVVAGIDDMQHRSMRGFDLVLNTEIGLREAAYEAGSVLLGERYALLRAGFGAASLALEFEVGPGVVPVLVMMGGTDPFGYLPRVLEGLARSDSVEFAPVVVAGASSGLEGSLGAFRKSRVLRSVGSAELAAWMRFCRIGIIACGSSLYECAAMDLPFLGLSLVDNQTATARKVAKNWGMPILCRESARGESLQLGALLLDLLSRAKVPFSNVDANGAFRVYEALVALWLKKN